MPNYITKMLLILFDAAGLMVYIWVVVGLVITGLSMILIIGEIIIAAKILRRVRLGDSQYTNPD